MNEQLSHLDHQGKIKMVSVSGKQPTQRLATAFSSIHVGSRIMNVLQNRQNKKGDAWAASRVAGVMAAKKTSDLIVLCHPIALENIKIEIFVLSEVRIGCIATATAFDKTGVEMEAMVAASSAMLNMYDMVKGIDKSAYLEQTMLLSKSGGKSSNWLGNDVLQGKVEKLCTSKGKGTPKDPCDQANLIENFGLEGDAHGGDWHRQVSLLGIESIQKMQKQGLDVSYGSFAENVVTSGVCLYELPIGSLIYTDSGAVMKVTQIGKECHSKCAVYYQAGDCVMPREGIFAVVLCEATISTGDGFIILKREE